MQLVGKIWREIVIAILLSGMPCIWIAGQPAETKAAALATQTYIAARAVAMSLVPGGSTPSGCVGTPRVLVSCRAACAGQMHEAVSESAECMMSVIWCVVVG